MFRFRRRVKWLTGEHCRAKKGAPGERCRAKKRVWKKGEKLSVGPGKG